ncbi:polysaccharide deacetylase family protein [Halarchaeum sp. P4]|uniref:polysaccharide deacetylase family protein n=1 Tax=Halarchaeum sp. P4 TaxID=3421639 RepID=UPI003EB70731
MSDGRLVLVFDDGHVADDAKVWPVLERAGVPACFAVVSSWVGGPDTHDAARLHELEAAGCEIVSHGRRHRYPGTHRLECDADAADDRVVVDEHVYPGEDHGVVPGDEYEVVDGDRRAIGRVCETRPSEDGPTVVFETPLGASFDAGESVLRPTDATLHDEIVGSAEDFQEMGLDVQSFVLPYDAADVRTWELVSNHYDVLGNASVRSLPNPPGRPLSELRRSYLETSHLTDLEVEAYLDALADRGGVGVLAGHSAWDTVTAERVERVVAGAAERDIEVTTFRDIRAARDA